MESKITWNGKMAFEANLDGHAIQMDADPSVGGEGRGPRPKSLLLPALAGCTGMDVISILEKMRQVPERFELTVQTELSQEHPKVFTSITLTYHFYGTLEQDKIIKAVKLSQEKYCGVSAMLGKTAPIGVRIMLNGAPVEYI